MVHIKNKEKMFQLMEDVQKIRNFGIIAHIDHGKTTLSDILLAKSGIISKSIAGDARVLDYLEEEQRRGITIITANISLIYKEHIINLVDTPGHVDFSGKVARALRVIDGCLVVIDAVEGVMVQTEILTRHAMSERVKPILFINKIDRLIKELKLSEDKIQERLDYIIKMFNKILENTLPPKVFNEWKITPHKNNIIFGSALHHWGFTYKQMMTSGKKFDSIIDIYHEYDDIRLIRKKGYELFPLDVAVLETVVEYIPNPKKAQAYRIPKIWKGKIDSKIGSDLIDCDPSGTTIVGINKIISDQHSGRIAIGRLFSGTIEVGDNLFLLNNKEDFRLLNLYIYMGANKIPIKKIGAGNIIAISGVNDILIGETLIDFGNRKEGTSFEKIKYSQDPVITVSIEPYHPRELNEMLEILEELDEEDPNLQVSINEETGENLMSGIGELQLELAAKEIEKKGIKLITSDPMVLYVETIKNGSKIIHFESKEYTFFLKYKFEPLDDHTISLIQNDTLNRTLSNEEISSILLNSDESWNELESESVVSFLEKNNIIIDVSKKCSNTTGRGSTPIRDFIIDLFQSLFNKGPLIEENIFGLKITLLEYEIEESLLNLGPILILDEFRDIFYNQFLDLEPVLLEPIYKIQITTPPKYIGKVSNLIERKRGRIENINTDSSYAFIIGYIPVSESFNLADLIRSKTSGWAFWQTIFSHWSEIPKNKMNEIINERRTQNTFP
ncbi:MAG: elongation factor EF-2 [Candidatus Lokiarchaeota archaeon]|nr:elongation factor EF-2 [Candidatus Lokiarchaeota archaeon]